MDINLDPQKALEQLWKLSGPYAQAKANRVYLDEYRKSLKAILMKASAEKTSAAQETEAYSHPDYVTHLKALQAAVEEEEKLRWRLVAAQAEIEIFRTMEASARTFDRKVR